jgi:hypothetical protein
MLGHEFANFVSHLDDALDALVDESNLVLDWLCKVIEPRSWSQVVIVDLDGGNLVCGLGRLSCSCPAALLLALTEKIFQYE